MNRSNDGTAVPDELVGEVIASIRDRFGAESFETQTIRGVWRHGGKAYKDELVRLFGGFPDTPVNRGRFLQIQQRPKRGFRQKDIGMITHPIEVLGAPKHPSVAAARARN